MYPASNGDAFLLRSTGAEKTAILIDGGFGKTFHEFIKPDLSDLVRSGYSLDLVIASHIDEDHVVGLLEFFKFNGNSATPALIPVGTVWHNSVRGLSAPATVTDKGDLSILTTAAGSGYPATSGASGIKEVSAAQGSSLAALLLAGQYHWNDGDGCSCIVTDVAAASRNFGAARVDLLGPQRVRLTELESWWKSQLRKKGFSGKIGAGKFFDDAFEFLSARADLLTRMAPRIKEISSSTAPVELADSYSPDKSITNASSISVSITMDEKSILFLGDSLAEDLVDVLKRRAVPGEKLWFDAVKISHHGSVHNTSPELLALIDSDTYFISGNGDKHHHPDFPVLKAIVDRAASFERSLYFNYSTPASRQLQNYRSEAGAGFKVHEGSTDWLTLL
ncbi:AVAST type 1 anti-phage system MBL fold metallo-hydrolase Avs1a [Undibacterium sp. Xuan67W]|uniref:AVAST type 1 anti-phage system MBL fold metallo-hydrolase Avs1a n=1 Tax=Undibacterium sp. Xuan67W TaxID=3413057 RepID=UPI003BEF7911